MWGAAALGTCRCYPSAMLPAHDAEALDRVRQLLEAQPDIRVAFAFGSVPAGRAGFESDIDIAVLAEVPLDVERTMELIRSIALATGRPVDLIDLRTAGPLISQEVLKHGTRLVCRDTVELADFIYRTLVDAADFLPLRARLQQERIDAWLRQ